MTQGPLSGDMMMTCRVAWPEDKICGLSFKSKNSKKSIKKILESLSLNLSGLVELTDGRLL